MRNEINPTILIVFGILENTLIIELSILVSILKYNVNSEILTSKRKKIKRYLIAREIVVHSTNEESSSGYDYE